MFINRVIHSYYTITIKCRMIILSYDTSKTIGCTSLELVTDNTTPVYGTPASSKCENSKYYKLNSNIN